VSTPAAKPVGIIGAGRIGQAMARITLQQLGAPLSGVNLIRMSGDLP
jgi:phosphoglycerate dehydrogenase-like enzyme